MSFRFMALAGCDSKPDGKYFPILGGDGNMLETTLAELTLNITDGKHGDCRAEDNSGFYFISCKDIKDGKIDYSHTRQIAEKDFLDAHKRTMLAPNDILVTNSGTIGRMAFIKDTLKTYRTTFQSSMYIQRTSMG